jgi:hypothetical protein
MERGFMNGTVDGPAPDPNARGRTSEKHKALCAARLPLLLATCGLLGCPSNAVARIDWEPDSTLVVGGLPTPTPSASVQRVFQVHVSPGGTVFFLWPDFNGDSTTAMPESLLRYCDGRQAFASNGKCPSYISEYDTNLPGFQQPLACRYYYLGKYLVSIYLQARYPDGSLGPVEEVTPVEPDSITGKSNYDAAVGPDGSVHVVWQEIVPNVPVDPAPYSNVPGEVTALPDPSFPTLFNRCGRDRLLDGVPDSASWIVGPDSATCVGGCGAPCDEVDPNRTTCEVQSQPCWRQLAPLAVICYRRRSPSGAWGPTDRNIAPYTDLNFPDTLRTCNAPRIAVDGEGWVYVVWAQKDPKYPSCAWRTRQGPFSLGPGGSQAKGAFNRGQFDCLFRKWDSKDEERHDGPNDEDPWVRVTEDPLPGFMPQHPDSYDYFQSDDPMDIMVTGSGDSAKVHLLLCRCPSIGVPCDNGRDFFSDQDLYVVSSNGGLSWSPRMPVTRSELQFYTCGDSCADPADGLGAIEMGMARFLRNSSGPVHVLYNHDYHARSDSCPGCPNTPGCFTQRVYNQEVFHRELDPEDPDNWSPPYAELGARASVYSTEDPPVNKGDVNAIGVIAADGSRHAFWFDDSQTCGSTLCRRVYHLDVGAGVEDLPDTVMTFSGSNPAIGCLDVTERNGIFHLLVGEGPGSESLTSNDDDDELDFEQQSHALYYKRGVLGPETPETIPQCDSSSAGECAGTTCWSGSKVLCQNYVVGECETLVIAAGSGIAIRSPGIEITVRGKLVAEGTESAPIRIGPYSGYGPERSRIGWWKGIRLEGCSARASLAHTTIAGAEIGLYDDAVCAGNEAPAACALADTSLPPGALRASDCRFAYNEIAGIRAEGDENGDTEDLIQVEGCEFTTNLTGLVLENVSAPDSAGYVIRGNRLRFNDYVGIEVLGKYGRTVVVDSNLVQGYGEDDFITGLPDTTVFDGIGILYDENANDAANGDTLRITRNTFYRLEGAGVQLNFLQVQVPGYTKTTAGVGQDPVLSTAGNFFYRVGTGVLLANAKKVTLRSNELSNYGVGVVTDNGKADLGKSRGDFSLAGFNVFYQNLMPSGPNVPPAFSGRHIIAPSGMTDTLRARGNYWSPVTYNTGSTPWTCVDDALFEGSPVLIDSCFSSAPFFYPSKDYWGVVDWALKGLRNEVSSRGPADAVIYGSKPNPFNRRTVISLYLPQPMQDCHVTIYDVQGRRLAVLRDGFLDGGRHEIVWDGKSGTGDQVPSGVYFCRLTAGRFDKTAKIIRMR